jgi:hypothetical protein
MKARQWTDDEVEQLKIAVLCSVNGLSSPISWTAVAELVGNGRTGKMCYSKWNWEMGGKARAYKPWSLEEDRELWRLRHDEQVSFLRIARHIPDRLPNELRDHYKTLVKNQERLRRPKNVPKVTDASEEDWYCGPQSDQELNDPIE